MPDNLNISTPITGNTTITHPNSLPKEPPQVNVIDPAKVTQPNTNKQSEQNTNLDLLLSRNSVFSTFVSQLRQVPALNQTLQKIMYELFARKDSLAKTGALPLALNKLTAASEMDRGDIVENLLFQSQNQTKFAQPVFDMLRGLAKQNPGPEFDVHLAGFLKAYDSVFSAPQAMKAVQSQLELLTGQLPKFYGKQLSALVSELYVDTTPEAISQNLTVLKEKILPLLSKYASATKDTGMARDTITLLVHTTARLNVGSREELVNRFVNLLDYCRYHLNLPPDKYDRIQELFANKLMGKDDFEGNVFFDTLIQTLSEGSKQNTSNLSQSLYKDVCSALLMDNSVYMPFKHIFLPLLYQGQPMFSEIWIEKDPPDHSPGRKSFDRPARLYLTFDIRNLGYFEAFVEIYQSRVSVELNYPPSLQKEAGEIHSALSSIFTQNGLSAESIVLSPNTVPKVPERILKKVYEWRNAVDVSV